MRLAVNIKVHSDLTLEEEMMVMKAKRIMEARLNSQGFKQFCTDYKFTYTTHTGRLWWKKYTTHHQVGFKYPNGLSGAGVYQAIMNGAETLTPIVDGVANIELVIDRRNKRSVLGYTYPNTAKQWVYSWLLRTTPERLAGNLAHEWCHKLGFKHKHRYNSTRKHSVPYAVGDYIAGIQR